MLLFFKPFTLIFFFFPLFYFYSHMFKIKSSSVLHSTSVIWCMRLLAAGYNLITMAHCRKCSSGERLNWWSWRLPGGTLTRPNLPRRLLWVCAPMLKQWSTCSIIFYKFKWCVLQCNLSHLNVCYWALSFWNTLALTWTKQWVCKRKRNANAVKWIVIWVVKSHSRIGVYFAFKL